MAGRPGRLPRLELPQHMLALSALTRPMPDAAGSRPALARPVTAGCIKESRALLALSCVGGERFPSQAPRSLPPPPRSRPPQRIEQQWQAMAMKACDPLVKAYWVCRQEQGLMVVFRCREEINAMRECVGNKTRDKETYAAFREERMAVIKDVMGSGDYIRPSHKEFKIPGKRD